MGNWSVFFTGLYRARWFSGFLSEKAGVERVCDYSTPSSLFCLRFCLENHARYSASQVWTHALLGFRANFVEDMPIADREEILKLLMSSERLLELYFLDQNKYLENHSKTTRLGLEQDAKYFWIFRDLDYEKWVQRRGEAKILGLHGPSTEGLELAASHIVQHLQKLATASQEDEVLLYFFYNSTRHRYEWGPQNVVGWRELVCVWNLLRQLIGNRSTAAGPHLQIFLKKALHSLSDHELVELRAHDGPTDALRLLLCLSKPQNLWDALGQVLGDLRQRENPKRLGKPNFTLIVDLNTMDGAWNELIDNIRKMTVGLQGYGTVRVLISNLPETSNLWQHRPAEILLEYDKERKGMYSPQIQSSLIIVGFRSLY